MRDIYSPYKIGWHLDILEALRAGRLCRPLAVQLHLTGRCNLRCAHCVYGGLIPTLTRPASDLDPARMSAFLRAFSRLGGSAVELTGGGEPTLHPAFGAVVDDALTLGLRVGVITNGIESAELVPRLDRLAWLRISLDAVDAETFHRRKGGGPDAFSRVLTLARLAAARIGPRASFSYLVSPRTTATEIRLAKGVAAASGLAIRFAPVYTGQDLYFADGVEAAAGPLVAERRELVRRRFEHPDEPCGRIYTNVVAGADGLVYPCCLLAYSRAHVLCSIDEFEAWWGSPGRAELLRAWRCRERCAGTACWYVRHNEIFRGLALHRPDDVEFV